VCVRWIAPSHTHTGLVPPTSAGRSPLGDAEELGDSVQRVLIAKPAGGVLVCKQASFAERRFAIDRPFPHDRNDPLLVVLIGIRVIDLVRVRADQVEAAEAHLLAIDLEGRLICRRRGSRNRSGTHIADLGHVDEDAVAGLEILERVRVPASAPGRDEPVLASVVPVAGIVDLTKTDMPVLSVPLGLLRTGRGAFTIGGVGSR